MAAFQKPKPSVVTTSGVTDWGMTHIEFILSEDFVGTIGGAPMSGANSPGVPGVEVYLLEARRGSKFTELAYTISAGSAILTTY